MFKRITAAAAVVLLAVFGLVGPAQAVGSCPSGWICFFNTSTSSTPLESRDGADASPGECFYMPGSANNQTSYIVNRTGYTWYVYNTICGDWAGTIKPNSSGAMGASWNNNISAYRR